MIATVENYQYVFLEDYVDVGGGVLYGVTLEGTLDMSAEFANVIIAGGLTLDTNLNVSGEYASLFFDDSIAQSVGIGAQVTGATINLSGYEAEIDTTSDLLQSGAANVILAPAITIAAESRDYIYGQFGQISIQGTVEDNTSGSILDCSQDAFTNYVSGTLTGGTWQVSKRWRDHP